MRTPTSMLRTVAFALTFSAATSALAAEPARDAGQPERPDQRHGSANQDFHFNAGPGWARDEVLGNVVAHSLTLGYRYGYFEPAIVGNFGTKLFGGSYAALGMSLGAVVQSELGPRFTLRGVVGSDSYSGVGCDLFCQRGGASATLPYAAVHAGASHVFWARGKTHLELGFEGFYGRDLERQRVEYSTTGGLFGPTTTTGERLLGGQRVGVVATVGLTFDTATGSKSRTQSAKR
ncbi:MAG: hypothetical protein AMXMBFR56_74860 [Polyangiaceae bacterium]